MVYYLWRQHSELTVGAKRTFSYGLEEDIEHEPFPFRQELAAAFRHYYDTVRGLSVQSSKANYLMRIVFCIDGDVPSEKLTPTRLCRDRCKVYIIVLFA